MNARAPRCALTPPWLLAVGLTVAVGCASAPPHTPATASEPAVECKVVDTTEPAEIVRYEEGGVRVHSFVAPAHSASTATHIIETAEALVLVDTQLLRGYAKAFREYADSLGKPIALVIVSHGHPDHFFGLEFFEDVPTAALAQTHQDIEHRKRFHLRMHRETERECDAVTDWVRLPQQELSPASTTIAGVQLEFDVVERAEDDTQLVIKVPAAKTLILQDLMATDAHGFTAGGMLDHWVEVLVGYRGQTEYTHVLAGHGRPVGLEGIDDMIAYVTGSKEVFAIAKDGEHFIALMHERFAGRSGEFIIEMMATMEYGDTKP